MTPCALEPHTSVPALESLNTSVGGSRPRSPAYAGIGTVGPQGIVPVAVIGPGSKFRPDRCRRLLRPASTREHAPCFSGPPALPKSAASRFRQCCFPPQFSPFGNPLSVIPPLTGTRQRGQTAGGNSTASLPARLKKPRGPSPPAEPRPAARWVAGTGPPLGPRFAVAPGGRARWSGREAFVPHTSPSFRGVRRLTQFQRLRLAPLAP